MDGPQQNCKQSANNLDLRLPTVMPPMSLEPGLWQMQVVIVSLLTQSLARKLWPLGRIKCSVPQISILGPPFTKLALFR